VSVLLPFVETDTAAQAWDRGFRQRLKELGWDSRNIRLDYRWASGNVSRLRSFAGELAELNPDVILAVTKSQCGCYPHVGHAAYSSRQTSN
jgi:ABC-type uncharacterized transport system substrate-binding protein